MVKVALVTGITGQDGSYLAEFLLEKGYFVYGLIRRSGSINTKQIDHIYKQLFLRYGDLSDSSSITKILNEIKEINDLSRLEIYNLGEMSHTKVSFNTPEYTGNINGFGVLRILDNVISLKLTDITRFYQASTSEMYGKVNLPQNENTPFYPRSPYSVAKLYGYWITKNYRESYNLFACNGILFNHESPRRGETFVTRKITIALNKIIKGEQDHLVLGNLDAQRDWGHAKDYVEGMWLMLQHDFPEDYVLATNETHSVREFVEKAFALKNIIINWKGKGLDEIGYCSKTNKSLIFVSSRYFRQTEVDILWGDSSKAKFELGWKPKISFDQLIEEMVKES